MILPAYRSALINDITVSLGGSSDLDVAGLPVKVRCERIEKVEALLTLNGDRKVVVQQ